MLQRCRVVSERIDDLERTIIERNGKAKSPARHKVESGSGNELEGMLARVEQMHVIVERYSTLAEWSARRENRKDFHSSECLAEVGSKSGYGMNILGQIMCGADQAGPCCAFNDECGRFTISGQGNCSGRRSRRSLRTGYGREQKKQRSNLPAGHNQID
jgi:hypothetical protein